MAKGDLQRGGATGGMVVARLFLGAYFLYSGIVHLLQPTSFIEFVAANSRGGGDFVDGNVWPQFAHLLQTTVAPHAAVFGWGIIIAELLLGALLLSGMMTRLAGALALTLSLLTVLATLHLVDARLGLSAGAIAGAFVVLEVGVILSAAGRTFGVDQHLAKKSKITWIW